MLPELVYECWTRVRIQSVKFFFFKKVKFLDMDSKLDKGEGTQTCNLTHIILSLTFAHKYFFCKKIEKLNFYTKKIVLK